MMLMYILLSEISFFFFKRLCKLYFVQPTLVQFVIGHFYLKILVFFKIINLDVEVISQGVELIKDFVCLFHFKRVLFLSFNLKILIFELRAVFIKTFQTNIQNILISIRTLKKTFFLKCI